MAWTERYVRDDAAGGGDGTTDTNSGANGAWTLAEAITNAAAGQRINVKNGTYSNTTTDRVFANAGSATDSIWWRGFNTTIGDIDSDNTLTKPLISFSTGYATISGANQKFSNIRWRGANTAAAEGVVRVTSTGCHFWRCRFEGTAADADCIPFTIAATGDGSGCVSCYFVANAAANCVSAGDFSYYIGCYFDGGLNGLSIAGGAEVAAAFCVFDDQAADAIDAAGNGSVIINCSIYSPAGNGVDVSTATTLLTIANCIFEGCGAYAINSSASATPTVAIFNNSYYNNTSGNLNNIDESLDVGSVTESASPFTDATTNNFTLKSTANAKGAGVPGAIENVTLTGYPDIGAIQRQEAASSGSGIPGNLLGGIFQ